MSEPYKTRIEDRIENGRHFIVWECWDCDGRGTVVVEQGAPWAPRDYVEACEECEDGRRTEECEDADCRECWALDEAIQTPRTDVCTF